MVTLIPVLVMFERVCVGVATSVAAVDPGALDVVFSAFLPITITVYDVEGVSPVTFTGAPQTAAVCQICPPASVPFACT